MDESPKQLIAELRTSIAMKPGQEARVDYEYIRNGVVNIFMANEPLKGKRFVEVTEFKTKNQKQQESVFCPLSSMRCFMDYQLLNAII